MNPFLYIVAACCLLGVTACQEPAPNEEEAAPKASAEGRQPMALSLSNWKPTAQHIKINSSDIGLNLDDAVRVLGAWDQVGDVMSDADGQYYPFSNRDGYDYIVRIKNDMINGVWKRRIE